MKNSGLRYQFVKDTVDTRELQVMHTFYATNWFDLLTKALVGDTFELHRQMLGVFPSSPRGSVSKNGEVKITMDREQTM